MNSKHVRVWPLGEYPTDSIDLVNERGDVVATISVMDQEDEGEADVLIQDKHVRVLVRDEEIDKAVVERVLSSLSKAMSITWLYLDSNEKLLELIEKLKNGARNSL